MTFEEAQKEFERDFLDIVRFGEPADRKLFRIAPNGEPYVVITAGGLKLEGAQTPCFGTSEDAAARSWLLHARDYARSQKDGKLPTVLYWRDEPELSSIEVRELGAPDGDLHARFKLFAIWSRFAVA